MSFLDQLRARKGTLKSTNTIVTSADGKRHMESSNSTKKSELPSNQYGFIVDTKPDITPAFISENICAGSQDCTSEHVLRIHGIKSVLSLGINVDLPEHIQHKFIQCPDLPESKIEQVLSEGLPFIHESALNKNTVLIHCNAGVSRTAMVGIAYLMIVNKMDYSKAYNLIKSKRPCVQPNVGFAKQLQVLDVDCFLRMLGLE